MNVWFLISVFTIVFSHFSLAGNAQAVATYQHDPAWPTVLDQFNWGAAEGDQYDNTKSATGVGVDRENGLVYVLVRDSPNVRVYREDGTFVRSWSPEQVGIVHMLHVDSKGNIWIADNGIHTVTKYSPEGNVLLALGTANEPGMDDKHFNGPTDVATTSDGQYIFIADGYSNNRIAKFDRSGNYLDMWGAADSGINPGEFILPHSLTVVGEKVYVADRSGGRIQVFDLEGHFIEDWRDVMMPWGIASDNKHLYVIGPELSAGQYPTTKALTQITLKDPYKPTLPPVGQSIVVFDTQGHKVQKISFPQGRKFGEVDWVHGVDVGANGDIYVADVIGNHIQKWKRVEQPVKNYQSTTHWGQLPKGRKWGATSAVYPAQDGSGNIWVAERCGDNFQGCEKNAHIDPVLLFDSAGKLLKSFGAGLLVWPHGIHVDQHNNVWVTDASGVEGKGHQVHKFSPDGRRLMSLGIAGVAGKTKTTFNAPSDVLVAPNGTIFVADGHGPEGNNRIVKFSADGTFIKAWGKTGTGISEFKDPHALAMDSQGRLLVGDRKNNRIQLFDQDGNFIAIWTQFGRPSGLFIDNNDRLYSADSESGFAGEGGNPNGRRGIYIGSAKSGHLIQLLPDEAPDFTTTSGAEGVAADDKGNLYGAEVGAGMIRKYSFKK